MTAFVMIVLWGVGLFTHHTMGGFAHVLLVLALVLGLIAMVQRTPNR